jgi:hypothetical protein
MGIAVILEARLRDIPPLHDIGSYVGQLAHDAALNRRSGANANDKRRRRMNGIHLSLAKPVAGALLLAERVTRCLRGDKP